MGLGWGRGGAAERCGGGSRDRAAAAAAVVAAGAVEESARARNPRGGSEPRPGPGPSRRRQEPRDVQDNEHPALTSASAAASAPGSHPADLGWGRQEGSGRGEVSARVSLLTFNLGMRWLGMRRARRSATAATGVLSAEDKQKLRGSSPRHLRLRHPLPGSDTPNPRQLLSFPPAATKEVGRTEGGVRSQGGRQAGGEEREIRLLGGLLIWMAV